MQKIESDLIRGLKGYAILSIFFFHLSDIFFVPEYIYKIVLFGKYYVVIFFFLSAYTVSYSISQKKQFDFKIYLTRRFIRIAIPYYFAIGLAVVIFWGYYNNTNILLNIIQDVLFLNIGNSNQINILRVEWSLPIIFWLYFIIPIFVFIIKYSFVMYTLLIVSILLYFNPLNGVASILNTFLLYLFTYISGVVLMVLKRNRIVFNNKIIHVVGAISVFFTLCMSTKPVSELRYLLLLLGVILFNIAPTFTKNQKINDLQKNKIVTSIIVIGLIFILLRYINLLYYIKFQILFLTLWTIALLTTSNKNIVIRIIFNNPVIQFFGKISYSMYLIHYVIRNFIYNNFLITSWIERVVIILVAVVTMSLIFYLVVEKPVNSLSKKIAGYK